MTIRHTILHVFALLLAVVPSVQSDMTLYTPASGDGTYSWNSKYGPYGYDQNATEIGIYHAMGGQYGNDYTVAIFEIPIIALAGQSLTGATLEVESLGFGTGFYYGSASIGWLDTGSASLTGDFIADNLGPAASGRPGGWSIFNSDYADAPGIKSFNVVNQVQNDINAGRSYSTFVLSGSRDTYGSIRSAESGAGPRLVVTGVVPEPASLMALGIGLVGFAGRLRRNA